MVLPSDPLGTSVRASFRPGRPFHSPSFPQPAGLVQPPPPVAGAAPVWAGGPHVVRPGRPWTPSIEPLCTLPLPSLWLTLKIKQPVILSAKWVYSGTAENCNSGQEGYSENYSQDQLINERNVT